MPIPIRNSLSRFPSLFQAISSDSIACFLKSRQNLPFLLLSSSFFFLAIFFFLSMLLVLLPKLCVRQSVMQWFGSQFGWESLGEQLYNWKLFDTASLLSLNYATKVFTSFPLSLSLFRKWIKWWIFVLIQSYNNTVNFSFHIFPRILRFGKLISYSLRTQGTKKTKRKRRGVQFVNKKIKTPPAWPSQMNRESHQYFIQVMNSRKMLTSIQWKSIVECTKDQ